MAEEKKNELIFSLHDNMTNELICSGNASIYIIKDGKKIVIAKKKLTIFPTKVEIEKKYLREKLYIELVDNPTYKSSPFPDPYIATIPICFCRQSLIQSVRFIPKGTYIGIVKAYGSKMGILNSKEEVYLSNWKDETISIAKDQTITLKAFLFYNVEKGKKKSSNRFFLNNDDIENSYSENIYWAFTISNDIFSYKTVDKRDKLKTISATLTLNNTQDRDIRKFSEKTQLNNSINNHHVYKLMRAGKEVTGHTINFSLSDIFSYNLLKNESLRENYYITFFAYEIEEKGKIVITYNETTDNLPLKQLKIVSNKYSMVFDGYHLELYENGKYVDSFNIEYSNSINLINQLKHNIDINNTVYYFKYSSHIQHKPNEYLMSDMLSYQINLIPYENKVNIGILYDQSDKYNYTDYNQSCSDGEYERQIYFNNAKSPNNSSSLDQTENKMLSIYLSRDAYESLMSKIYQETDILVKYITKPKYVIEVTRYKEVYNNKTIPHMVERYGATYGVFAIYVYYKGEKFLLDSVAQSMIQDKKQNIYDTIKLNEKDGKNNIKKVEVKTLNLTLVNDYILIEENRKNIKKIMDTIKLKNKATYSNLKYGGYTMEPAGPDNITSGVQRRIPEGHYKGVFHNSDTHYQHNTMKLYNDLVSSGRAILIHAGKKSIVDTEGCILVSSKSYENDNGGLNYSLSTKEFLHAFYRALLKHYDDEIDNLYKYVNVVIRNDFGSFGG